VLADLAGAIAHGARVIIDCQVTSDQPNLFGFGVSADSMADAKGDRRHRGTGSTADHRGR
jgi:hypothetical protein